MDYSNIDYSLLRIKQIKQADFSKLDIKKTMTQLRSNPFDMNLPNTPFFDMLILWTGALGFCIVSANDKRYSDISFENNEDTPSMSLIKKNQWIFNQLNFPISRRQCKSLKNKDDDKLQDGNKQYLTSLFVYYMAMIYCQ